MEFKVIRKKVDGKKPRGLRNHNPLNIRDNAHSTWLGQAGNDGSFCYFLDDEWGYRAAFRLLRNYYKKYRLQTIQEIITRWAPPKDGNNTDAYIKKVANMMGVERDFKVGRLFGSWDDFDQYMCEQMVYAMAIVENGEAAKEYISKSKITRGYELAFPYDK